jgi:LysM domain
MSATYHGFSRHRVVSGDTLFGIAEAAYGDGDLWPRLLIANRDRINDPDVIVVGQVLRRGSVDRSRSPNHFFVQRVGCAGHVSSRASAADGSVNSLTATRSKSTPCRDRGVRDAVTP